MVPRERGSTCGAQAAVREGGARGRCARAVRKGSAQWRCARAMREALVRRWRGVRGSWRGGVCFGCDGSCGGARGCQVTAILLHERSSVSRLSRAQSCGGKAQIAFSPSQSCRSESSRPAPTRDWFVSRMGELGSGCASAERSLRTGRGGREDRALRPSLAHGWARADALCSGLGERRDVALLRVVVARLRCEPKERGKVSSRLALSSSLSRRARAPKEEGSRSS